MKHIKVPGAPYEYTDDTDCFLADIVDRVEGLHATGDLSHDVLQRLRQYFKIKNIYHSNAIEGNQLNVGQTKEVVEGGVSALAGSTKDRTEAANLSKAHDTLEMLAQDERQITAGDVRALHQIVLQHLDDNAGSYRTQPVIVSGSRFDPTSPERVPTDMDTFSNWLKDVTDSTQTYPTKKLRTTLRRDGTRLAGVNSSIC